MAQSLDAVPVAKLESFLVCSICLETLNDPRTLPCFHSYCRSCLEKFVKKQRDRAQFGQQIREFNCPTCRNPFTLNPEDKVEDMGQSHFIYNMLEVMAVDQHRVKGVPCTHCERPSVGRCVTCEVFLCNECLKIHSSYLGFKDHAVLSMDELSKPENQTKVRGKLHCREHKKKTLKFYCETCQELICRRCMDFNHNKAGHSCLAVEDVAEKEKEILVSNSAALEGKLLEGKNALKKVINAKQSLEKVKEQTKRDINQRKDNLLKVLTRQLNDQAQHLLKEVEEICVGKHKTLSRQEAVVKGYVEKLESCVSLSKGLLEKGNDEEILSSAKMMKSNIEKLQNETPKKVEPVDEDVISYKCNPINLSKISVISEEMGRITAGLEKKALTFRDLARRDVSKVPNEVNSIRSANEQISSEFSSENQRQENVALSPLLMRYIMKYHMEVFEELRNVSSVVIFQTISPGEELLKAVIGKSVDEKSFQKAVENFIGFYQKLFPIMYHEVIPVDQNSPPKSSPSEVISAARSKFMVIVSEETNQIAIYGPKEKTNEAVRFINEKFKVSNEVNSIRSANEKIPSEKLSCFISNRVKLLVYQGDIAEDDAHAIVNPANENLKHVGGAALAILNRGGRSIQTESDDIMKGRRNRPLCPGDVEVTSSGNLPCNFVVHAIGPQWTNHREDECRKLLKKAVLNSLSIAGENGAQTIAIPVISSRIYGVPMKICAEVLFTSVKEYVNGTNGPVRLTEIRFVNIDGPTVKVFVQEMKRRFGSSITNENRGQNGISRDGTTVVVSNIQHPDQPPSGNTLLQLEENCTKKPRKNPSYSEVARNSSKPQNDQTPDSGPPGFWFRHYDKSKNTR